MSIQSAINKGVAVAGALYTQTPAYSAKKTEKLLSGESKEIDKAIEKNRALKTQIETEFSSQIEEREKALLEKLSKKDKSRTQAEIKGLKAGKEENVALNEKEFKGLLKRKADLTGNYKDYASYLAEESLRARERSKAVKRKKIAQAKAVKDVLAMETSLGISIKDLNLSKEQLADVKKQLKENK